MSPPPFLEDLGYPALFLVGVLGNMGVPVPEKTFLLVAGYLVWTGDMQAVLVIGLGLLGAVIGANLTYWLGRALGRGAVDRYARRFSIVPERVESTLRLLTRYGFLGIVASRFLPGVRFMVNAAAGVTGLCPVSFSVVSACAALAYLPLLVGAGYVFGLRFGNGLAALPAAAFPALGLVAVVAIAAVIAASRRILQSRR